ncbi:MAG TPA: hypothetical protein VGS41_19070, partial [Chthonomonadales bacterium]|nr:hypothetical protein [Chthonomonadales bacterium]
MKEVRKGRFCSRLWFSLVTLALITVSGAAAFSQSTGKDLLTPPGDKPIRGMCWPALSPDGSTLCF